MTEIHGDMLTPPPIDRTSATDDQRIENILPLPPPAHLIQFFPIKDTPVERFIADTRRNVRDILHGESDRLLVVIGPCSIHDPVSALEYASRLKDERDRHSADLEIVMRVYFEKPRTTVGWKGLINDPYMNGSFRINEGLRIARDLLVRINQAGVPAGCEFLDVISPSTSATSSPGARSAHGPPSPRCTGSWHRGCRPRSVSRTEPTAT
jgi:3-deoxy-7-phosphoheptulonate synthase